MYFGPLPVSETLDAVLAHAVALPGRTLKKGTRLDEALIATLKAAGIAEVVVAKMQEDDVGEDEAALAIARALTGENVRAEKPATGRSNLFSEVAGLLEIDRQVVDAINSIDPAITIATRQPDRAAEPGRMLATIKIIPFAIPRPLLEKAVALARPAIRVAPFRPMRVAAINTQLPSLKYTVIDKTLLVLQERLNQAGAEIIADLRVSHNQAAVQAAFENEVVKGADLTVIFGASAVVDDHDVIPEGLRKAGGEVVHIGIPVDPGNLLLIGSLDGKPVIGAPGCARSPQENGFDWVLERVLAGRQVTSRDIMGFGVGGLLMDIVTRPSPRSGVAVVEDRQSPQIAAIVLAAGRSSRMGGENKLLKAYDGDALVVRAVRAASLSRVVSTVVVTGHMANEVAASVRDFDVVLAHNPAYAEGLSTSLIAGLRAIPEACEAAIILLGDMPKVDEKLIDRLIEAYDPANGELIVVPNFEGKRGNPVLWSRRFFADLMALEGDVGARHLIERHRASVVEVSADEAAALDLDTPEAWANLGA